MHSFAKWSASHRPRGRVVVTGIGIVSPFGVGREICWSAICAGRSAVRWLDSDVWEDCSPLEARWAGAPAPSEFHGPQREPVVEMALAAAREAVQHAGLSAPSDRGGCVIGTSKLGLRSFARALRGRQSGLPVHESFMPNDAARAIAAEWNLPGAALCPVAACATGLVSLIRGADLIRSGECEVVFAGSSDASLVPIVLGSFQRLGVLARGFHDAATACRPFDAERSGFVIGEGAAVLVLEDAAHALARGATPLAEFVAGGLASDPSGLTQLDPDGTSLAWLIRDVLRRADVSADEVDAINLHGTGTPANDATETRAIRTALGAAADRVVASSQKGAIGHLLGAAGSIESAFAVLSLRDQVMPPTINLRTPDPACDLDYVANVVRPRSLRTILKVSLGFGGHVAVGLFRTW